MMNRFLLAIRQVPKWAWVILAALALILITAAFKKSEKNCLTCYKPAEVTKPADPKKVVVKEPDTGHAQPPTSETEQPVDAPKVTETHPDQCEGGSHSLQIRSNDEFERVYISLRQPGEEKPGWHYLSEQSESPALLVICDNVSVNFLIGFDGEFDGESLEIALLESGQKIPLDFIACDEQPQDCEQYGVVQDDTASTYYVVWGKR